MKINGVAREIYDSDDEIIVSIGNMCSRLQSDSTSFILQYV